MEKYDYEVKNYKHRDLKVLNIILDEDYNVFSLSDGLDSSKIKILNLTIQEFYWYTAIENTNRIDIFHGENVLYYVSDTNKFYD